MRKKMKKRKKNKFFSENMQKKIHYNKDEEEIYLKM